MDRTTGSYETSNDGASRFFRELRQLRATAGLAPAELAARAHYPHDVIVAAEVGPSLPDLPVLSAYVRGCGAGLADWEERWRSLTGSPAAGLGLPTRPAGSSGLASAGARLGAAGPAMPSEDQRRIMAAISRAGVATAAASIPTQPHVTDADIAAATDAVAIGDAVAYMAVADTVATENVPADVVHADGPAVSASATDTPVRVGATDTPDPAGATDAPGRTGATDTPGRTDETAATHTPERTGSAGETRASGAAAATAGIDARVRPVPRSAAIAAGVAVILCLIGAILLVFR